MGKFKKLTVNDAKNFYNERKTVKIYLSDDEVSEKNYLGKCTFTGDLYSKKIGYIMKSKAKIHKNWLSTAEGPYGKTSGRMIYGLDAIVDGEEWNFQICFKPKNVLASNCYGGVYVYYKS